MFGFPFTCKCIFKGLGLVHIYHIYVVSYKVPIKLILLNRVSKK